MSHESQWTRDVQIQTTKELTTTGGTVWTAARRLSEYLEHEQAAAGLLRSGTRVLELGAGCGLLGLLVARNCPGAAEVCLTEQAFGGALAHLRRNVEVNQALPNMGCVTTAACDWSHFMQPGVLAAARMTSWQQPQQPSQQEQQLPEQQQQQPDQHAGPSPAELSDLARLLQTQWDIIIGSDLIYNKEGAHALPRVLAALMQQQPGGPRAAAPPPGTGSSSRSSGSSSSAPVNGACHCPGAAAAVSSSCSHHHEQQQPEQQHQQLGPAAAAAAAAPQPEAGSSPTSASTPCCYYCHTKHRFDALDVEFFEQLEAQGLAAEEVVEAGAQLPPPSPPPFSSLFPDMRIAVFRITCANKQQQQQQQHGDGDAARRDAAG